MARVVESESRADGNVKFNSSVEVSAAAALSAAAIPTTRVSSLWSSSKMGSSSHTARTKKPKRARR